jgi:hypothetical protein
MKGRYLGLLVVSVVVAVALTLWGRTAARRTPVGGERGPIPNRPVELVLMISPDGAMTPPSMSVEKGRRIDASLTNTGSTTARVELPGYEDRFAAVTIEPGDTWRGEFLADRPGDDFAWMVNGKPAGRLMVTGSHLIEGHR